MERIHTRTAPRAGGDYVVYWMRTAMRATENPALDAALRAGRDLKKPVFVYQGLSEHHPYASDRHHSFILEGARDVAVQLGARGIGYAFHLQRKGHRGPHLRTLAQRAALVVTEDFPVAPAARIDGVPLWHVDTACVVPFRAVTATPERAFAFRAERQPLWAKALAEPWRDAPGDGPFLPALPFTPVSFDDLDGLIAECDIDHAVAPAQQLTGGTTAGLARWSAFVQQRLAHYASDRADPLKEGNSRMSPYLHYGMVSPFRLARDAQAHKTEGAEKFLDELLVWRELAYAFCAREPRYATVDALPAWARATLRAHEGDPRLLHAYETLARAQTGDVLWDAAQRSLLTRGELHNAVRMTWGKSVLGWTRDAAHALAVLIDLNHRYALDGRDPASHLGILWCLGGFDRAFAEVPVFGAVRPPVGRRFDLAEYARRTRRPARGQPLTVAVVGAGVAGAACARALADAGQEARLFDDGAEPGGRFGPLGTPGFTAQDPRWLRWVQAWKDERIVAPWNDQWAGAGLVKRMLHGLDVRSGVRVAQVEPHGTRWRLVGADGAGLGEFEAVVLTAPAPVTAELLRWSAPVLSARAAEAVMDPQWVTRASFGNPIDFPDVTELGGGLLQRILRIQGKWTLVATPAWSRLHGDPPEVIGGALLDAFWTAAQVPRQPPVQIETKRWEHARVAKPLGVPCLFDADLRLGAAGDWCLGSTVEAAFLSGCAAAGRIHALRGGVEPEAPPLSRASQLKLF